MTPVSENPSPITDAEIAEFFTPLAAWPGVMLAVSGGPDSLALLHLYARWRTLGGKRDQTVLVATVDHGLRAQSRAEAEFVAGAAHTLGFDHKTLIWEGPKPATGRQDAARNARYRLMAARLERMPASPRALVTAHTLDDQAETVLMRLARGSGLDGLAAMAPSRPVHTATGVTLVRPLLGVPGARLRATLAAMGQAWIEDPSNRDPANERVRVRQLSAAAAAVGLTNEALSLTAIRLRRAHDALEAATTALEQKATVIRWGLSTTIQRALFEAAPLELRLRLLGRALTRHGGSHPKPRLVELERLVEPLESPAGARTLGGCLIVPRVDDIIIVRELGRDGLGEITLAPAERTIWDDRFEIALAATAPMPIMIRAMPIEAWNTLKTHLPSADELDASAAVTLPTVWHGKTLIGVPRLAALTGPPGIRHIACISPDERTADPDLAAHCTLLPLTSGQLARRKFGEKA